MSNVKAGDRAITITTPWGLRYGVSGRLCTVLYQAPSGSFALPDGFLTENVPRAQCWVLEMDEPMSIPMGFGMLRRTRFGVAPDAALRPLHDPDASKSDPLEVRRESEVPA